MIITLLKSIVRFILTIIVRVIELLIMQEIKRVSPVL